MIERVNITIRTVDGLKEIPAWRDGHFAVHQIFLTSGLFGLNWAITHVPSGMSLPIHFNSKESTAAAMAGVAMIRDDWARLTLENWTTDVRKKVREICDVWGGEIQTDGPTKARAKAGRAHFATDLNGYGDEA